MNDLIVPPYLVRTAIAAACVMAAGTVVRLVAIRKQPNDVAAQRLQSLKTWWIITSLVIGAALAGPLAIVILAALVSLLALREYAALPFQPPLDRNALWGGYGLVLCSYGALLFGQGELFVKGFPLLAVLLPSTLLILSGDAAQYTRQVARMTWGLLVTAYGIGHLALLVKPPPSATPDTDVVGLFLFVVAVTEVNDIAQALGGRRIGRRKLSAISPRKTWEGFACGLFVSVIVAVLLGRWLTTLALGPLAAAGVLISVAGLLGDLNISGLKREVGVKDSGTMVPGQGGILDRIDSLTFTAPLFYYFYLYYWLGTSK
ncbi:phosphatidate cytidylyltransferase [Roseimaritima ulvae]|uniref:Phosphatidate cytidylyltransferase n=1 Tax=Roseimaritima ulvae TaxID=980254 RepID=A0A5B9QPK2_9BACT|nr:phosphatidate cytidylyltransferase [Roseimaritima ulvae]QEG40884.1 Phosphatidate cytidylyltransferase [Roseimaritima ulvae]